MRRARKSEGSKTGTPLWMATFSDLVTLLLTFFVMLMSMASFDETRQIQEVMQSFREALQPAGMGDGLISNLRGDQRSDLRRRDVTFKPLETRDREKGDGQMSDGAVPVADQRSETRLILDHTSYFETGGTALRDEARAQLRTLGQALSDQDVSIFIDGHTDAVGEEGANWSLSMRRAMAVCDALHRDGQIPRERLWARGYGPSRPTARLAEDAARNRRIEIVLSGGDAQIAQALEVVRSLEVNDG